VFVLDIAEEGRVDKGSLEVLLGQGASIEEIATRFGKHPSTVAYWMQKYGLVAVNREKHAARGRLEQDELEAGMTIAEIAAAVDRSKATVRHWLGRFGLRTRNSRGRRPADAVTKAKADGLLTASMTYIHHGGTEFVLEGRGCYRCKRCRSEAVAKHRRKIKAILTAEAGGRCIVCGYDRCVSALEFHHLDPSDKRFAMSQNGVTLGLETARAEAQKCVLVCANCHAEIERGITSLPDTVARATRG
jgi:transposase